MQQWTNCWGKVYLDSTSLNRRISSNNVNWWGWPRSMQKDDKNKHMIIWSFLPMLTSLNTTLLTGAFLEVNNANNCFINVHDFTMHDVLPVIHGHIMRQVQRTHSSILLQVRAFIDSLAHLIKFTTDILIFRGPTSIVHDIQSSI